MDIIRIENKDYIEQNKLIKEIPKTEEPLKQPKIQIYKDFENDEDRYANDLDIINSCLKEKSINKQKEILIEFQNSKDENFKKIAKEMLSSFD